MGSACEDASTEPGTVGWTYQVSNAATQYLAAGQTATEKFTVTISDGHTGGTVDQLVTFFFFNDTATPEISTLSLHAALPISEDATTPSLSDTGTIAFNDVDLTDGH